MPGSSYVVFGAGGPTGTETVKALASDPECGKKGNVIYAAVRDPLKYVDKFAPLAAEGRGAAVETVAADVTDKASVERALQAGGSSAPCRGVVFAASGTGYWTAKAVDHDGVRNVAEAAASLSSSSSSSSKPRVVLVSSMLTHPENRWHPIRILLNNIRWSLMDEKFRGEEALAECPGADWCVIRPGGLINAPAGSRGLVKADKDVTKEVGTGSLPRADVAAACVRALSDPRASRHKFSIYARRAKKGEAPAEAVDPSSKAYGEMVGRLFD
jgi:uncharacterized protein YbjT (DUF2867 family)